MLKRTRYLVQARLAMTRRAGWPVPAFVFLAALSTALALLVRGILPLFPHALLANSVGALLLSLPLLSDLGTLLRHDEGREWVGALPVRPAELALARAVHLLLLLGGLALAWFVPWALFAPGSPGVGARLVLVVLGLAFVLLLATLLVWTQLFLLARSATALVLLESALVVLLVVALVQLLGHLPELAQLDPGSRALRWFPPAWFARPLVTGGWSWGLPSLLVLISLAALPAVPVREALSGQRRSATERWVEPLRRLAAERWVRPEERGAFDLVALALPREREVALRTYPMLGIPLAFLWISATGREGGSWRADLLALLLFTVGVYLPLLLTHVPLSESHQAAWILRTAPCREEAVREGAIKALFVRYLLPLYAVLLGLGLFLGEFALLARLWLPALLLALLFLRLLYARCVRDLPLSIPAEELRSEVDWAGIVAPLAMGLTVLAVLANRFVDWRSGLGLALGLALVELILEQRGKRRLAAKS